MKKLRLLNLKNIRHRRTIIKAFGYIKVWWKETGNKLFSTLMLDRERSKLKPSRLKSDVKENSLTQSSGFFQDQFSSSALHPAPLTTVLTPAERVCTGLEIFCSCLRQHRYPERQAADYTLRNLAHNTLIQQCTFHGSHFSAALGSCSQPFVSARCPFSCASATARYARTVKWANFNTTLLLEGLFQGAISWENAKSAHHKASKPYNRQVNLSRSHKWGVHTAFCTHKLCTSKTWTRSSYHAKQSWGLFNHKNFQAFLRICTMILTGLFQRKYLTSCMLLLRPNKQHFGDGNRVVWWNILNLKHLHDFLLHTPKWMVALPLCCREFQNRYTLKLKASQLLAMLMQRLLNKCIFYRP